MKHAYLRELQSRLLGSVTDDPDTLEHFSTDQSIFTAAPTAVVYPQNTADVCKTVQFADERTASGRPLPIVARGKGSDQSGGSVGEGLQIVFPAHMNKLIRLDRNTVTVQPGIIVHTLQQALYTHLRHIPQAPIGDEYSTIGGVVASASGGEKSVKYGTIRRAVRSLKVVLADGSLIETRRISARELNRKKGLSTLEGELYRKFDNLLTDHEALIKKSQVTGVENSTGYDLWSVRGKNGSFDLSQVFIGSQGTLGLITEITLAIAPYNPRTTLVVGNFDSVPEATAAVKRLLTLEPSAVEIVDHNVLEFHHNLRPADLKDLIPEDVPRLVMLVEFDNASQFSQKLRSTKAARIIKRHNGTVRISTNPVEQVALWKIRRASVAAWLGHGPKKALPFVEDAAVPVDKLAQLFDKIYKLLAKHDLEVAIWGHAGTGNLRFQPRLDLARKKDVDKLFTLSHEYIDLVISLGGVPSATHNDNLLRAASLAKIYGEEFFELLATTKHIFDPQNIFNPTKKTGATEDYIRAHLRTEFARGRQHDYLVYT